MKCTYDESLLNFKRSNLLSDFYESMQLELEEVTDQPSLYDDDKQEALP